MIAPFALALVVVASTISLSIIAIAFSKFLSAIFEAKARQPEADLTFFFILGFVGLELLNLLTFTLGVLALIKMG